MDVEERQREVPQWLSATLAYDAIKAGYAKVMTLPILQRLDAKVADLAESALEIAGVPHDDDSALATADSFIDSVMEKVDDSVDSAALRLKTYVRRLRAGPSTPDEGAEEAGEPESEEHGVQEADVPSAQAAERSDEAAEEHEAEDDAQSGDVDLLAYDSPIRRSKQDDKAAAEVDVAYSVDPPQEPAEDDEEQAVAHTEALSIVEDAMLKDEDEATQEDEAWNADADPENELDAAGDPLFASYVETDSESSEVDGDDVFATPGLRAEEEDEEEGEDLHERRILESIGVPSGVQRPAADVLSPASLTKTPASAAFDTSDAADLDTSW
uniref:Uncharacterized protein n=1 Tax=Pinguiococcus pyrenoidosus TaxID=172671 RepID=A0A7R9UAJ7_9STRA